MILPSVDTCRCDDEPEKLGGTTDQAGGRGGPRAEKLVAPIAPGQTGGVGCALPTSMNEESVRRVQNGSVNQLRPEESEAAQLLRARLGADEVIPRYVPGAPEGTHDFDLTIGNQVLAVEVTTSADAVARSFWDAVHNREWEEPSLSRSWGLTLTSGARVHRVKDRAPRELQVLEHSDVTRFRFGQASATRDPEAVEALRSLADLGIQNGISSEVSPSRIHIATVGDGAWGGAEGLREVVEHEASTNAGKLSRAHADERHLFIWLDWTSHRAQAAVSSILRIGVAPPVPELPTGVDTVWVAPSSMVDSDMFLWSVSPPDPWNLSD